ncbi:hypothetical protein ACWOAH_09875 [Vagococcus vulneris]|uniref:Uncharacterized protein n=1 Tax=Vagococcus vulneris TaxID=1977869 RepID=A0A429ZWU9_9ENTE|nr:hypothetical protein [Vagococcus vulneris]RST98277.1 hypothetical protein CBF37_08170 [Vagococcus vulneris]
MEQEIKELKERIIFLEALLELNSHVLEKAIETNRILIEYLKEKKIKINYLGLLSSSFAFK